MLDILINGPQLAISSSDKFCEQSGYVTSNSVTFKKVFKSNPAITFSRYGTSANTANTNVSWISGVYNVVTLSKTGFTTALASHEMPNNLFYFASGYIS